MSQNAAIALPGKEQVFHSTFSIERISSRSRRRASSLPMPTRR